MSSNRLIGFCCGFNNVHLCNMKIKIYNHSCTMNEVINNHTAPFEEGLTDKVPFIFFPH